MRTSEAGTLERWNALLDRVRDRWPLYRGRLPPGGLASLDQVAGLPFTTKDDFRAAYPLGMLAVPREEAVRVHMSSGTTGRPVVTAYTRHDLELWADSMERVLRA